MQTLVYGDVLFAVNFSIDFLVLALSGYFLKLRRRVIPLILAAVLGGGYAVFSLWLSPGPLAGMLLSFGAALLLCLVAYAPIGFFALLRLCLAFYIASFFFGGAINAFYSLLTAFFGTDGLAGVSAVMHGKKAEIFLLYAFASGILIYVAGRFFSHHETHGAVQMEIEDGGRTRKLSGLIDSGNLLSDPISGRPVILVRRKDVAEILPPRLFTALDPHADLSDLAPHIQKKIRLIPMSGVGGARTLIGYIPDAILLYPPDREKEKYAAHAMLAIYEGEIRDFGGHAAIVPHALCR